MVQIFCHHDADGLISAYFTKIGLGGNAKIIVTEEFGDSPGWKKGDYMVDMRPKDTNIEGTVIDHHPCIPGDALIQSPDGKIGFARSIDATVCISDDGEFKKSTRRFENGTANKFIKIRAYNGWEVEVTPNHRFFVDDNGSIVEKKASDLTINDRLLVTTKLPEGTKYIKPTRTKLLGYYFGDGSLSFNQKKHPRIRLHDKNRKLLEKYQKIARDEYNARATIFKVNPKYYNGYYCNIDSREFYDEFKGREFDWTVLKNTSLSAFIAGFYDAEGSQNTRHKSLRITNTDLVLLRKMKIALLRFGIFSYISHQVKTKHKGKRPVDVYNLTIADKESLLLFKKFIKPYKFINWKEILSKDFKYNRREGKIYTLSKVMKLEEISRNSDIYDFESPSGKYILNGFIVHNSHPSISERKYKLIWEDKPASLICWEHFKEKIPKKEWWKVCLLPNTKVYTYNDVKCIQDLERNDEILSSSGNYQKVLESTKRPYSGLVVKIKPSYYPPIECTIDHPVKVATLKNCKFKSSNRLCKPNCGLKKYGCATIPNVKIQWKKAGDLMPNDFILVPKLKERKKFTFRLDKYILEKSGRYTHHTESKWKIPMKIDGNEDFFELLGWYVAEGSVVKRSISFSLGITEENEANRIKELIKTVFNVDAKVKKYPDRSVIIVRANSAIVSRFLVDLVGKLATKKNIGKLYGLHGSEFDAFIRAYIKGDGCETDDFWSIGTASETLARQLQILLNANGYVVSYSKHKPLKNRFSDKPFFTITYYKHKKWLKYFEDSNYIYVPASISYNYYEGFVYNIETEDHTYLVPYIVHNCIGASGDGQVEKVPYEVFETSPELFKVSIWKSKSWSSKWSISAYPAYKLLSSPINAFARFGQFNEVLSIIEKAKSPLDILHSPEIFRKKDELKRVFEDVMSKADVYDFGNLKIIIFSSPKVRLSGYIASVLGNDVGTVMAINSSTGSLSLRGDLALYYREKLKPLDYIEIDGHPGFMGGKIHTKPQKLIDDLFNLL